MTAVLVAPDEEAAVTVEMVQAVGLGRAGLGRARRRG
jgi:hypothetical protein